jgi:hypothetical protein
MFSGDVCKRVMLMDDDPAAIDLSESDSETKALIRLAGKLFRSPAPE